VNGCAFFHALFPSLFHAQVLLFLSHVHAHALMLLFPSPSLYLCVPSHDHDLLNVFLFLHDLWILSVYVFPLISNGHVSYLCPFQLHVYRANDCVSHVVPSPYDLHGLWNDLDVYPFCVSLHPLCSFPCGEFLLSGFVCNDQQ